MAQPKLRRRIGDTAEVFNDLAFVAGASPRLFFQDITLAFSALAAAPTLPSCHAVIVVVSGQGMQATSHNSGHVPASKARSDATQDIVWFPQTVKHIPDVYALLHAVLNSSDQHPIETNSVLGRLEAESRHSTLQQRAILIQEAADLREAFVTAVVNGIWGVPLVTTPHPDRYYVFVLSASTGKIFRIDSSEAPEEIDTVISSSGANATVLTDGVVGKIRSIVASKAGDGEAVVVGLVSRTA